LPKPDRDKLLFSFFLINSIVLFNTLLSEILLLILNSFSDCFSSFIDIIFSGMLIIGLFLIFVDAASTFLTPFKVAMTALWSDTLVLMLYYSLTLLHPAIMSLVLWSMCPILLIWNWAALRILTHEYFLN